MPDNGSGMPPEPPAAAKTEPGRLWGGRFGARDSAAAAAFDRFSSSFSYDRRLAHAEARGTRAWARALAAAGILTPPEAAALDAAAAQLAAELAGGPPPPDAALEDVHTYVAQRLEALAGPAARKLQTGRSRNEQISLDLRLYCLDLRPALDAGLRGLVAAFAAFAERHAAVLVPGYTHLQRAQPVSLGHHALAYAEMLQRDRARLADAYARVAVLPLGSGALAGCSFALDREALARELGLAAVSQNSLDAVSDRDFAAELLFALALLGVHLSRWAEDWI
ncbi:MAG: lyase family protein, partial [Terriglobales bacterium]